MQTYHEFLGISPIIVHCLGWCHDTSSSWMNVNVVTKSRISLFFGVLGDALNACFTSRASAMLKSKHGDAPCSLNQRSKRCILMAKDYVDWWRQKKQPFNIFQSDLELPNWTLRSVTCDYRNCAKRLDKATLRGVVLANVRLYKIKTISIIL